MDVNYIYLLQEREFIKTKENVYKVGRSCKPNLERFNNYPKGSILLFQIICKDCITVENQIIKLFKEEFTIKKDIGNEYFEGDYKKMIDLIYTIVKTEKINNDNNTNTDDNNTNIDDNTLKYKKLCKKISTIFPDYINDESFGGVKKYIKIKKEKSVNDNNYVIYFINFSLMKNLKYYYEDEENQYKNMFQYEYESIISKITIDISAGIESLNYFNNLISKKVILLNTMHDINSTLFINEIKNTKINLTIENYKYNPIYQEEHNTKYILFRYNIIKLLVCNTIINNELYSSINTNDFKNFNKLKDFNYFTVDIGSFNNYVPIQIYKINSKYYEYETYIRKYTPYLIRWDINSDYYILNRDYEYIGFDTKCIKYEYKGESYIFDDCNKPWNDKKYYIKMCNKYKEIIKENNLKKCLNLNDYMLVLYGSDIFIKKEYVQENDVIHQFITDRCELINFEAWKLENPKFTAIQKFEQCCIKFKDIYEAFRQWTKEEYPEINIKRQDFKKKIEKNYTIEKNADKNDYIRGLRFKNLIEE
jgi:hypothetical protein